MRCNGDTMYYSRILPGNFASGDSCEVISSNLAKLSGLGSCVRMNRKPRERLYDCVCSIGQIIYCRCKIN